MQARHATVDLLLAFPTGQGVQLDAPTLSKVSVTEPALHVSQVLSPDGLYLPAGQALQCEAPTAMPLPSVSVLVLAVKFPAPQEEHCTVELLLYFASGHLVQLDAPMWTTPVPAPLSTMEPAAHAPHCACAVFP